MPDAINLVSADGFALFLTDTTQLPAAVGVQAAARNPWVGGCPTVTVEAWASGTTTRLDAKTFRLRDPWSWCGLSCEGDLDCYENTRLLLAGHTGNVTFVMKDSDGAEIGRSTPVPLSSLPDIEPDGGGILPGDIGDADGPLDDLKGVIKWSVLGALVILALPVIQDTIQDLRDR